MILPWKIIDKIKPEPLDAEEHEAMDSLAQGDYEVYSTKLDVITEEAMTIFRRVGISTFLRAADCVVGIYTKKGDLVTASCGTMLHAVSGIVPIKFIMEKWFDNPTVGVRPGDIFYCNEAIYGGVHNPDQFAFMPIFHDGELLAWTGAAVHQPETGAKEPGGMPLTATTRHDEGMKLTPIKIGENYQLKDDLMEMMVNMVSRAPRMQLGDVKARVTACDKVRVRIEQLARQKGSIFLNGLFRKMITVAAEGAKMRIGQWNDGVFRHVAFMDSIGREAALVRVFLEVRKKGEQLFFDFTGTSPQNDSSFNAFAHIVLAHSAINLLQWAFHDFPVSSGLFVPIEFHVPEGTFLNADLEAAISNSVKACSPVLNVVHVCMSKILYHSEQWNLACAPMSNTGPGYGITGRSRRGIGFSDRHSFSNNTEGTGATFDHDGVNSACFAWGPWGKANDSEDFENEYPFFHLFQKHLRDSCGHGKYRGGVGTSSALVVYKTDKLNFSSNCAGSKIPSGAALFGGYPAFCHPGIELRNLGLSKIMGDQGLKPSSIYEILEEDTYKENLIIEHNVRPTRALQEGEVFIVNTFGGGGYGDPLEREPEAVAQDVGDGIISCWTARQVYRVVCQEHNLFLDRQATKELREAEREDRKKRGLSFEQFVEKWGQEKPPAEIMTYYGQWPEPRCDKEAQ